MLFGPRATVVILKFPSFQISWAWSDVFRINERFIQQLSAMFTCRDGKGNQLSNQASKMLYSPPGVVNIASYKESLNQSDCWKLFAQLWNYKFPLFPLIDNKKTQRVTCFLLTEFEVRTVSYGSVTYSTDREDTVSRIFIVSILVSLPGSGTTSLHANGFKFLTHFQSKTNQFEIVVKWLWRR